MITPYCTTDRFLVRPAQYGSHFGNAAYAWDHNTVRRSATRIIADGSDRKVQVKQKSTGDVSHMWARSVYAHTSGVRASLK